MEAEGEGENRRNPPLMTNALKLLFVLRIRLDPQTGREHELPDRGAEAGEEGVEGLVPQDVLAFHFLSNPMTYSARCARRLE